MRSERDSVEEMEVTGLLLISLLSPSPCIPGDTHGYTMGPAARAQSYAHQDLFLLDLGPGSWCVLLKIEECHQTATPHFP